MPKEKKIDLSEMSENERCYRKAVELLAVRAHSVSELKKKLSARRFQNEAILQTITNLLHNGYLNDENFAQTYLDSLIRYKTFGYYGIKAKLMQKGIEGALADRVVSENMDSELELKLARKFLGSKQTAKEKAAARLQRRGFRSDTIRKALEA